MKYKSKGEEMMYEWYIAKILTNPAIRIEKEYDFHNLGCSRHLKSDFFIFYNNIPLGDIEVNGEQHLTNPTIIERDNYKKEWLNNNCIDYIYAIYKSNHYLNFTDWYYEQWHHKMEDVDYPTNDQHWWHITVFEQLLWSYNRGINLYTAYHKQNGYLTL